MASDLLGFMKAQFEFLECTAASGASPEVMMSERAKVEKAVNAQTIPLLSLSTTEGTNLIREILKSGLDADQKRMLRDAVDAKMAAAAYS